MSVADYNRRWEYLSHEHERKDKEIQQLLDDYKDDNPMKYRAYAVLGTYGVGKTQFLYHIHASAVRREIIPLYFLAEDLFRRVIERGQEWTPGNVYSLVEDTISEIVKLLSAGKELEIRAILDPREKVRKDSPEIIERVLHEFSGKLPENPKIVLFVDELEGQYGRLQEIVQTKDISPLREWLESKTHLKFLAFAPAGIYGLGGADRDRVKRIILPPADVRYIRDRFAGDAGRSNSCWWLSRGKARQLFKTAQILEELEEEYIEDAAKVSRIIKQELDFIGQPPTEVPPAVIESLSPSKIPFLFRLSPSSCEKKRRYIVSAEKLETGKLADRLIEAFRMNKDSAILISEYFKKTVCALSNDDWDLHVNEGDLPELFCLTLDHFLEYEHGSPEMAETFGEILSLYERSKEEPAAMHGTIGTLWERKDTDQGLPFSIQEIREAFPFPTMNPIVKDHMPDDMEKKWEGRDLPLWMWAEANAEVLFFASARDFAAYSETDEFISLSLPDGKGVLCFLPYGQDSIEEGNRPLFKWLRGNGKLEVTELQNLLTDFLLSASGELSDIPGDLQKVLGIFREDKKDILLSRKTEIYRKALDDTVAARLPKAEKFYRGDPPDADNVWGKTQISNRALAVSGIALAFSSLTPEEQFLLADLRELFKGGREGSGVGDLQYLISAGRGGHTRLPDRLLPYRERGDGVRNTEVVEKLKTYWRSNEVSRLEELARILPLENFLKLHQDEDISRLLESLWRTVREVFDTEDLNVIIGRIRRDVIPALETCRELEETASGFGSNGIDFGDHEKFVKSLQAFKRLLEIAEKSAKLSPLVKSIVSILAETVKDTDSDIAALSNLCDKAKRAIETLNESAEKLRENLWEYEKGIKFTGLKNEDIEGIIDEEKKIDDTPNLQQLESQVKERREYLDDVSTWLARLDQSLGTLGDLFKSVKGIN